MSNLFLDNYRALKRGLKRKKAEFGLFFVVGEIEQHEKIIEQISADLEFGLYNIQTIQIKENTIYLDLLLNEIKNPDIVLIRETPNLYSENLLNFDVAPPLLLSHLNLQRDRYKKEFAFPLVFLITRLTYKLFLRKAPDFFDWKSGLFLLNENSGEQN